MLAQKSNKLVVLLAVIFFAAPYVFAVNSGNTAGQAWLEKLGWISLGGSAVTPDYGVTVADASLAGYAWSEKTGWINFDDAGSYYAVTNDGAGNLSGYAWSEKLGYISFDDGSVNNYYQVTMNACAEMNKSGAIIFKGTAIFKGNAIMKPGKEGMCLAGYAWSEQGGYINFDDAGELYDTTTTWAD